MVASTHAFSLHLDFASATVPFRDLDLILHGIELRIVLPSDESL